MTRYLDIDASELIDAGTDEVGRETISFTLAIVKVASDTLEEELLSVLEAAGVGTRGVNLFVSTSVSIPSGDGPYLSLRVLGGASALRTQNQIVPEYRRPSVQVVTRASSYVIARAMAQAAQAAFAAVRNTQVNP